VVLDRSPDGVKDEVRGFGAHLMIGRINAVTYTVERLAGGECIQLLIECRAGHRLCRESFG